MQVQTEKKEGVAALLTVTVPAEDVKVAYKKAFAKYSKNAKIDGFRKGHIPANVLKQNFGYQIFTEAYDALVNQTLPEAIKESKLKIASVPEVKPLNPTFKEEDAFVYEVALEIQPEIELKDLAAVKVVKVKSEVTDADVEKMIVNLQKQQGKWEVKDDLAVADGTRANIDFLGRTDGVEFEGGKAEGFDLIIGQTSMIPGFSEQIVGHKAGDAFTIQVKFPEEYHAENLKGKDAEFDIKVNTVAELKLPEVNEDFAKIYGVKDGSVETLKADLRKNMERELNRVVDSKNRSALFDALVAAYGEFAVPKAFVEDEAKRLGDRFIEQMRQYGLDPKRVPAQLRDQFKESPEAYKNVRVGSILAAYIRKYEITEANEEFVNAQLQQLAGPYENPEEVIAEIKNDKQTFRNVQEAAMEAETIAKLFAEVEVEEQAKSFDELVGPQQ